MTNIQAITQLDLAFTHNKDFKKKWTDYIGLAIIEAINTTNPPMDNVTKAKIAQEASKNIIQLFDPVWWASQEGIKL